MNKADTLKTWEGAALAASAFPLHLTAWFSNKYETVPL
jgi:hypothetical protein